MTMRKLRRFFADLFFLMKPYFVSEERRSAWALLVLLIALNLAQVGMGLAITFSRNIYYTALQQKDAAGFFRGLFWFTPRAHGLPMPGFFMFAVVLIGCGVLSTYVQQWLQIRWQRWMTSRFVADWLSGHAHFRMMIAGDTQGAGTDNPDQRIQEDVQSVTDNSLTFATAIISNIVTVLSYGGLLWALSGPLVLLGLQIHGYLLWAAILYSFVVTYLTHLTGRRLISLSFLQQRFQGNFRFSLVQVRDNAEAVALYGGEGEEQRGLNSRFRDVYLNFIRIINRSAWLSLLTGSFGTLSENFPLVIASPRYFASRITFGTLMQISQVFSDFQGALLWFMNSYAGLANYAAQLERLATFQRSLDEARAFQPALRRSSSAVETVQAKAFTLALPGGSELLEPSDFTLQAGRSTAIVGPSGSGKSTLFRALAGIWPFASGTLAGPPLGSLFLPQRPYLPEGTLRRVLCYPMHPDEVPAGRLADALTLTGLTPLAHDLDLEAPWSQRLSPGEQQRVALARALLLRPSWLFLDEATSSLDAEAEGALYAMLRRELPETTLVSITHRDEVARLHERVLRLAPAPGGGSLLVAA